MEYKDLLVDDVLYVPGLSRRLFSVTQWTSSGGELSFNGDICNIAYEDNNVPPTTMRMTLRAPFSPGDAAGHLVHPVAAHAKIATPSGLLHHRLGHRSIQALGAASEADLWEDTSLTLDEDTFCWGCEITFSKKAKRGKSDLTKGTNMKPGSCLMLDIQKNASKHGLNAATHFPYYLQITDAVTRFTVLLGLKEVTSYAIFECLLHYSVWFKPNPNFEIGDVDRVHADAGSAFRSEEFISDCEQHGIKVSFAAPRHQEMNGICERAWASIRNIAFSFLVHARVGFEYYSLALEQAWKIHACLPIKNLLKDDKPISPYEFFHGHKPCLRRFRVMFCPCVINIGDGTRGDQETGQVLNRRNNPERGIRGVHVGIPRSSAGWLVYIPSTGSILVSSDVVFDEDFLSTVAYTQSQIPGGVQYQPPSHPAFANDQDVETTENPARFAVNEVAPGVPFDPDESEESIYTSN